ncbi:MAG: nuclear transport factor 2 family protein [Salaquimonas sp.]
MRLKKLVSRHLAVMILTTGLFICLFTGLFLTQAKAQSAVDRAKILAVNNAFYESFSAGDLKKMQTVWSATQEVGMIPPGRDFLQGIQQILYAFSLMMQNPPEISCQREGPIEFRNGKAIIVCNEKLGLNDQVRMMNVFAPETFDDETEWKMIYHGPIAEDKRRT